MGRMTRTRAAAARLAGALLLAVAHGVHGGSAGGSGADARRSEVALRVTTVAGVDGVDAKTQAGLEEAIGDVLSTYVEGGFPGRLPRQDFVQAFDDFHARTGPGRRR